MLISMSISMLVGVGYLLVLPMITVIVYSACVVASKTSEEAEMSATKNSLTSRSIRLARVPYHNRAVWQRPSLRS